MVAVGDILVIKRARDNLYRPYNYTIPFSVIRVIHINKFDTNVKLINTPNKFLEGNIGLNFSMENIDFEYLTT